MDIPRRNLLASPRLTRLVPSRAGESWWRGEEEGDVLHSSSREDRRWKVVSFVDFEDQRVGYSLFRSEDRSPAYLRRTLDLEITSVFGPIIGPLYSIFEAGIAKNPSYSIFGLEDSINPYI